MTRVKKKVINVIIICISRPPNHSLTKIVAEASQSQGCKDFAAKVYTTFFVQPKICNYV
jgi:hypothetical protein